MRISSKYLSIILLFLMGCVSTPNETSLKRASILYMDDEFPWDVIKIMSYNPRQFLEYNPQETLKNLTIVDSITLSQIQCSLNQKYEVSPIKAFDTWIILLTQDSENITDTIGIGYYGSIWRNDSVYFKSELMYIVNDIICDHDSLWKKSVEGHIIPKTNDLGVDL